MNYVYIDESGDIGSKSAYIVFAAIITEHDRRLEKLVKKTWKAKPQFHSKNRLHAVDVDDATKIRMLSRIAEFGATIKIRPFKKNHEVKAQISQYYEELAEFISQCGEAHTVIVERKDTKKLRTQVINQLGLTDQFATVVFGDPHEYKQLQAVDFVAWAYGRKAELSDSTFSDIIGVDHG